MDYEDPTSQSSPENQQEGSPLDEIIARVGSYMQDPSMVTPQTLGELKMDLEDLKAVVDGEPMEAAPEDMGGGLSSMMGGR